MRLPRALVRSLALASLAACSGGEAGPPAPEPEPTPIALTATGGSTPDGPYLVGQSVLGRHGYVEYIAGDAPVILTAPHGGTELPDEIPDRTESRCGGDATITTDLNTAELVIAMRERWFARFGNRPHVVVMHLARRRLDPNRPLAEAACGDPEAEIAYGEWHAFIDAAKEAVLQSTGKGWYMDMHGHGHVIQRLEIGYLLSAAQLDLPDAELDANPALEDTSSVRTISRESPATFSELLRGPESLGSLYAAEGFPALPSAGDPRPSGSPYFSGGDDTRRHGCGAEAASFGGSAGGNICGVQIEANFAGVRDDAANRDRFGDATARVLERYLFQHWGLRVRRPPSGATTQVVAAQVAATAGASWADLAWSGASGPRVDVWRNGTRLTTTENDGSYTDRMPRTLASARYKICEEGVTRCSNEVEVRF